MVCEQNFGQSSTDISICEGLPECADNEELAKEWQRQREADRKQMDVFMMTIANMSQEMREDNRRRDEQFREQMMQMHQNTMMAIASMPRPQAPPQAPSGGLLGGLLGGIGSGIGSAVGGLFG